MKSIIAIAVLAGCVSVSAQDFKYEISTSPEIQSFSPDQKIEVEILEVKGSIPTFQPGGEYLLNGKITSENPDDLTIYFGNTSHETNSVSRVEEFDQRHNPEENTSHFTVALKMQTTGEIHLSVYSKTRYQSDDKNNCVYKLILN